MSNVYDIPVNLSEYSVLYGNFFSPQHQNIVLILNKSFVLHMLNTTTRILIWYLGKVKANDTFSPRNTTKPNFLLNIDLQK